LPNLTIGQKIQSCIVINSLFLLFYFISPIFYTHILTPKNVGYEGRHMIMSYITRVRSDQKILNSEIEDTNVCENLLSYIHTHVRCDQTPSSYSDQLTQRT